MTRVTSFTQAGSRREIEAALMKQTTNKALIPPDLLVRQFPTPEKAA